MHALSYLQKRGHLSAVALGRKMFARVPDMTPARFDLMYVIFENSRGRPSGDNSAHMGQARIRRILGLTRQTIFKMVKRLVELGLLEKWPRPHKPLRVCLQLTPEGVRRVKMAYAAAFSERYVVSREDGGMDAPRHVHRRVRRQGEASDHIAKHWPRKVLPFATRAQREAWWGPSDAPPKVGREVAKVFTAFAFTRAGKPDRGRRDRMLDVIEDMVRDARKIARALGDRSALIYSAPRRREPQLPAGVDKRLLWLHADIAQSMLARQRATPVRTALA